MPDTDELFRRYLKELATVARQGDAREESYYPAFKGLVEALGDHLGRGRVVVTVLPKPTEAGNPDFRVWDGKSQIIGYAEAKTPGADLDRVARSEQLRRYRETFDNVLLTDFLRFVLFREGAEVARATLAEPVALTLGRVPPLADAPGTRALFERFFDYALPAKLGPRPLAERLARLTRFLRDQVIEEEVRKGKAGELYEFYQTFKKVLIADLTEKQFADLFAQTLTYGLFAARIRAEGEFNRRLAYDLIPHTLGVLRDVFRFISLAELPEHLEATLDDIAAVLQAADVAAILSEYQKSRGSRDPIVHFYETFLAEYDPELRERRGVYYTPEPVVHYIVESVHHLLKARFAKTLGLAEEGVTLLDPAAGTLTFPALAVERAAGEYRAAYGEGAVGRVIKDRLLPHYYAFELMMAPYAVGHLKIGLVLEALGYRLGEDERFNLYLTNALELEEIEKVSFPFLEALSAESRLAGEVKRERPILVILGNPPYSGNSANKNAWTERLLKEDWPGAPSYYKVDGEPLGEKNPKWLQDDYVKFLRFAQWKIAQHGEGLVAMITNHSYLDNPTFRGMRQSLLTTFDEIYILNLHGNSLKRETAPDGGPDENVFDIRQGVAIGVFVKRPGSAEKKVYYADLWGKRKAKYAWLTEHDVSTTEFTELRPEAPFYFFVPRATEGLEHYRAWPRVDALYPVHSVGIVTARDKLAIAESQEEMARRLRQVLELDPEIVAKAYGVSEKAVLKARADLEKNGIDEKKIVPILYRPFDQRWTYFSEGGFLERPREEVMRHMLAGPNRGLATSKRVEGNRAWEHALATNKLITHHTVSMKEVNYLFPLHLYLEPSGNLLEETATLKPYPKTGPELFEGFLRTLAHRAFRTPLGQVVEIRPAHLFRLVAGQGKGFVRGSASAEEALARLIRGEAGPRDLAGYERGRARFLDRFAEVVTSPDRVLIDREKPGVWLFVKDLRPDLALVAVFKELGEGRLGLLSFHPKHPKKLKRERYQEKWTPAGPSRPAGSAGLGGGEAPSPGSSENDYTTAWVERRPNLDPGLWTRLVFALGRPVSPEDLLAYAYAVLYTLAYREKYAEFLRVDFPRVPFPADGEAFFALARLGRRLIELHTLEAEDLFPPLAKYHGEGEDVVERPRYDAENRRLYINKQKYFAPVSPEAWAYRIGGYQVLEKWLKDRKGKELKDPETFQKIITAIERTIEVQRELDALWPALEKSLG